MLGDFHRRQKPLFEYRWRDRPIRSLVYAWGLALRPWKLWRTIDIHDPPRMGLLLVTVLASVIAFLFAFLAARVVPTVVAESIDYLHGSNWPAARGNTVPSFLSVLPGIVLYHLQDRVFPTVALGIGGSAVCSLLALFVFRQGSMPFLVEIPNGS